MRLCTVLVVICIVMFSVTAFADYVHANFNLDPSLNVVPAQGWVTFVLNADGTISATVAVTNGFNIRGFAYNSSTTLFESNFSPAEPDNKSGFADGFGGQASGFYCPGCSSTESFTIGNPGDFTSVFGALNGGSYSTVDFFLQDSNGDQWGAQAIPEPSTVILLASGLGMIRFRRKLRTVRKKASSLSNVSSAR